MSVCLSVTLLISTKTVKLSSNYFRAFNFLSLVQEISKKNSYETLIESHLVKYLFIRIFRNLSRFYYIYWAINTTASLERLRQLHETNVSASTKTRNGPTDCPDKITITKPTSMTLSSWQTHCESSPLLLLRPRWGSGVLWWACLFVCPQTYLRNHSSDLQPIFVLVTSDRGSFAVYKLSARLPTTLNISRLLKLIYHL